MNFADLVRHVLDDTVQQSLRAFLPELTLCATIVGILLVGMILPRFRAGGICVMVLGTIAALYFVLPWDFVQYGNMPVREELFTGLLVYDSFSVVMRTLLIFFGLLLTSLTLVTGLPHLDDAGEFFVLVLGALLGMCLMVSANHLLVVFLAMEMASVPSYVLAGFLRQKREASEAALKYAVFGAGTAGVMLYGISLLAGNLGSAHLPTLAVRLAELNMTGLEGGQTMALVLAGLMIAVGLAFKLSAVPFHFWAPDVFEGTSAEVGAFLSVASKAAALGLLVRLVLGLGYVSPEVEEGYWRQVALRGRASDAAPLPGTSRAETDSDTLLPGGHRPADLRRSVGGTPAAAPVSGTASGAGEVSRADERVAALLAADPTRRPLLHSLEPARRFMVGLLTLLSAITCTFGNLAAYGQTNIKRMLAYSTIAHAGYLLMPVAALAALLGQNTADAQFAIAALVVYVGVYLFMNLGAFAVVAVLRDACGSEVTADYAGLVRRSPAMTITMAVVLFSLVGLPPLAGFVAKFAIFGALVKAGLLLLLAIGGLNTVLSLFYYLRVVRVMVLEPEPAHRPAPRVPLLSAGGVYCALVALPLVVLFVWAEGVIAWAVAAASTLIRTL